jgi:zinc-ribbon domain
MDIGSLLLGLALLVVIVFVIARPLIERLNVADEPLRPVDLLLADRERVLTQLRDLDFDQTMSKINAADYAAQRAQLVAEGVAILKKLDALGLTSGEAVGSGAGPAPAGEIEAAVAQLRARRAAPTPAAVDLDPSGEIEAGVAAAAAARRTSTLASADKIACPQCGANAVPGDRFCARCGTPLPATAAGLRQAKIRS